MSGQRSTELLERSNDNSFTESNQLRHDAVAVARQEKDSWQQRHLQEKREALAAATLASDLPLRVKVRQLGHVGMGHLLSDELAKGQLQ